MNNVLRKSKANTETQSNNSDFSALTSGNQNSVKITLDNEINDFIKKIIEDIIKQICSFYNLDLPSNHNMQKGRLNPISERGNTLAELIDIVTSLFADIYFRETLHKSSLRIDESKARKIFNKLPLLGKFLNKISSSLKLSYSQILNITKTDDSGNDIYYLEMEKEKIEANGIKKIRLFLEFLKNNLNDNITDEFDLDNVFSFKNTLILSQIYKKGLFSNVINPEILLYMIKITSINNLINGILDTLDKSDIVTAINILNSGDVRTLLLFLKETDLLFNFFAFVEYLILLKNIDSINIDEDNMVLYLLEKKLGINISMKDYQKYKKSGISENIKTIDDEYRKVFLLRIIFSNINIFCNGGDFTNQNLFGLIFGTEEKKFELILSLFRKGLTVENLELIMTNNLEEYINSLTDENIRFFFQILSLGVKIENLKDFGNEELNFLRTLEIKSSKDFYVLYYLIINNRENYKNVILNLSLRKNLLNDLEKLDEKTPGYQELDEISKRKDFLELDNEELKAEIRGVYERYGITNILKKGLEVSNTSSIQGGEQYCENDELKELIDSLELDENVLRIVYDIFNLLDENTREDFVFWLANNIELEKLEKILEILSILKELNINIFSIGNIPYDYINRFSKIDLSNFTDVEAILSNLSNIDLDYLRQTLSIVKENKINGEINKHISIYLYTLDRKPLDEYIKECLRAKEIAKHTQELDIYTSEIINSGNEDQINKLGQKIEKMMENIFRRFHPEDLTSTKKDNNFGKGSGGISRSIRGLVLQKLKKRNTESYLEYLLRIRIVNLKGLIQLDISESGRSKETLLIRQKIASEDIGFFRFLEILGDEIITHMEQGKGADLDNLVKHFNSVVSEETSKLKKSLNI